MLFVFIIFADALQQMIYYISFPSDVLKTYHDLLHTDRKDESAVTFIKHLIIQERQDASLGFCSPCSTSSSNASIYN